MSTNGLVCSSCLTYVFSAVIILHNFIFAMDTIQTFCSIPLVMLTLGYPSVDAVFPHLTFQPGVHHSDGVHEPDLGAALQLRRSGGRCPLQGEPGSAGHDGRRCGRSGHVGIVGGAQVRPGHGEIVGEAQVTERWWEELSGRSGHGEIVGGAQGRPGDRDIVGEAQVTGRWWEELSGRSGRRDAVVGLGKLCESFTKVWWN